VFYKLKSKKNNKEKQIFLSVQASSSVPKLADYGSASLSPRAETYPTPPQIVSTPHQSFTSHQSSPSNWSIISNAGSIERYYGGKSNSKYPF
jgi:hypothetical protein